MRLAIYSRSFPPVLGGMERFGEDLARWLAHRGHHVTVLTETTGGEEADRGRPFQVIRGADVHRSGLAALRRADAVHVSGLSLRGIGLASAVGRRAVVTHHGYQAVCPTGLMMPDGPTCHARGERPGPCAGCPRRGARAVAAVRAHRAGAAVARRNVAVSHFVRDRIAVPRSMTVHNGLSPEALARRPAGPGEDGLIAFAGRLVGEKGIDLLLRAVALLPNARLEVAGDGPLAGSLEGLAEDLGIAHRAHFRGRLPADGVLEMYERSAVVCVPSRWHEPFGYSVAEAMAIGKAVIAGPMGAFPELLGEGRGLLAEDTTPQAFAGLLERSLGDAELREKVGKAARAFANRTLHMDVMGRGYERLYEG